MENKYLEKFFFIFFSIIPISMILGPSVSLINIIIINFLFIYYLYISKDFTFLKNKIIVLLLILYIYLIFNSFISIDPSIGIKRNLGFLRFILLFLAFNYFFYYSENSKKIIKWWSIILFIFVVDVFVEFFTGSNTLGFGDINSKEFFGPRIVGFFKDEPIAGAFVLGFFLIIIGNFFNDFEKKKNYVKILIYVIAFLFLFSILVTGERSNSLKALAAFLIFFSFNHFIKNKTKILFLLSFSIMISFSFMYSDFLKYRFNDSFIQMLTSKEKIMNTYQRSVYSVMYKTGFQVFIKYPIFGVGNKNFRVEICQNDISPFFGKESSPYQLCTTHPHQIYFEFLAEHGIIGSILLLSILFFLIFRLLRIIFISKNYLQFGCFLYLILVFTPLLPGGSFFNDFSSTIFWTNFSLLYASNKKTNIFN